MTEPAPQDQRVRAEAFYARGQLAAFHPHVHGEPCVQATVTLKDDKLIFTGCYTGEARASIEKEMLPRDGDVA